MRKQVFGRHFKRDRNERQALFKGLMTALIMSERIETTEAKAKAIRPQIEKLVTKAKNNQETARYFLSRYLAGDALEKMITTIAPRFTQRPGGYTRIIRLGRRMHDGAEMAVIEWVVRPEVQKKVQSKKALVKVDGKKESDIVEGEIVSEKQEKKEKKDKVKKDKKDKPKGKKKDK